MPIKICRNREEREAKACGYVCEGRRNEAGAAAASDQRQACMKRSGARRARKYKSDNVKGHLSNNIVIVIPINVLYKRGNWNRRNGTLYDARARNAVEYIMLYLLPFIARIFRAEGTSDRTEAHGQALNQSPSDDTWSVAWRNHIMIRLYRRSSAEAHRDGTAPAEWPARRWKSGRVIGPANK